MFKVVAVPVVAALAVLAIAPTPASAGLDTDVRCRRVYVDLDPVGQPGFSTCL